jgi:hypothetical protein
LQAIRKYPFWTVPLYDGTGPKAFPEIDSLWLEYVNGYYSFKQATSMYNQDVAQVNAQWAAQNQSAMAQYTKQEKKILAQK